MTRCIPTHSFRANFAWSGLRAQSRQPTTSSAVGGWRGRASAVATLASHTSTERPMTQQDACTLLDTDHQKVERLFAEYQAAHNASKKSQLAQEICMELTVHATIEEEIFYPAFRAATRDDKLVEEAQEEHQEAKD